MFGNTKSHEVSIMKQILSRVLFFTRCTTKNQKRLWLEHRWGVGKGPLMPLPIFERLRKRVKYIVIKYTFLSGVVFPSM